MIQSLRPQSVRVRLACWYAATMLVVVLLYAGVVYGLVYTSFSRDLNHRLYEVSDWAEHLVIVNPDGTLEMPGGGRVGHGNEGGEEKVWVEIWGADGRLLYRSASLNEWVELLPPLPETLGEPMVVSLDRGGDRRVRMLVAEHEINGAPGLMRVLMSEKELQQTMANIAMVMGIGLPIAVIAAGGLGYFMARRAMGPVDRMADEASRVTADRLGDRLKVENPYDELGHLAQVFNQTFSQLERSFGQLRRFTADASHELRTPLTTMRSVGDVGLQGVRDGAAYREIIGSMLEEVDRLTHLVESLLILSRADDGHLKLKHESIDLAALTEEVIEYLGVLAEEKKQRIDCRVEQPVIVLANAQVLRHAIINLVDNAIKYSPEATVIRVTVGIDGGEARIDIGDEGPGIPPEHLEHIFDRFYRVDVARSRDISSTGLGLSIATWAVEEHGGRIELNSEVGQGSVFSLLIPLANNTD